MTADELAAAFRADFAELHAQVDALPDGQLKRRLNRLARVAHGAMEQLEEEALGGAVIESGGEEKPPPGGP